MSKQRNHGDRGLMTHKPQQQRESMKSLSQFMSTRMCCLREKQVVQIMLTLTDRFTHLFLSHTFVYHKIIAGNFRRCTFSLYAWLQSPQQKCSWVLVFAFQCQETTPTNSFACEISLIVSGPVIRSNCNCV